MNKNVFVKVNKISEILKIVFINLFYAVVFTMLIGYVCGYKYFFVMTGSMGSAAPEKSIIVTVSVPLNQL